ncbi:uncharacterized protein LOC133894897 isoform X1 [Phragmites australis]|uniref:uncharacterized protein LOC133894897 isoform X1 n=2 Tax=Phragmites australis TaxID=29695 RepID=UPI002D7A0EB4|nr:uncharacterized protein LOC133894897 isoform X1 [Phragmites australis]
MEAAADPAGDAHTFKADFTATGVELLRGCVREKLREFMSGPDDTLVDYVILLLRNGRCKDEASKELNVFLEDDSAVFVSWLWDHLSLHLHLYVQAQEEDQEIKDAEAPKEVSGRQKSSEVLSKTKGQTHSELAIESSTTTRRRNKREWKGIGREGNENFPLRSVLTDILHGEEKRSQKSNEIQRPPSKQQNGRKRDRDDEPQQTKRDLSSRPMIGGGASRRLLQFAVRDAVKAVQPASSSTEPASKRLRSVVSTASADKLHDKRPERSQDNLNDRRSERTRPILQAQGAALALRAAAKAAADSTKVRSTGTVFKRLGQGNIVRQPSREEKRDYEDFEPVTTVDEHDSDQYDNDEESGELTMADREAEMNVDSTSDDDVNQDDEITRYQSSGSHEGAFSSFVEKKALLVKCSVEPETNAIRPSSVIDEEQLVSSSTTTASKTVAIPVDVNTVEPLNYETPKDVHVVEKPYITPMNANVTSMASNVKELGRAEVQKDSPRSAQSVAVSYSTAHPIEDADSRTLYVSNVHFAATKDSLSRHFNKFGAVLKVVIVTNAATGQPTGSAYVEFLHKESAERALSLNGTSFMTRILKVVRRSSHEAAHFYGWPGSGRSSLYARHGRMAYPRAVLPGSSFRGRAPMKAGARSLQWKREPSGTNSSAGTKPDMSVPLFSEQVLPPAT